MKLTEKKLRSLIRQIIVKEGLGEDLKAFDTEMGEAKGKLKEKAVALKERQQLIKAAGLVSEKLDMVTEALGKIPVFEVLNELKKTRTKNNTFAGLKTYRINLFVLPLRSELRGFL